MRTLPNCIVMLIALNNAIFSFADSSFSFDASLGRKYDDNVSVQEIDANTAQSDQANLAALALGYDYRLGSNNEININVSLSKTDYNELDAFDIDTYIGSVNFIHEFDHFKSGLSLRHAESELGGDNFLTLDQVSPYITTFIAKNWFLRTAYTRTKKDLIGRQDKDADRDALSSDIYYFFNGLRSYCIVGYKYSYEDAQLNLYDYDSHTIKARYIRNFSLFSQGIKWRVGLKYENREYDDINPIIQAARSDDRASFESSLEVTIAGDFFAKIEYERNDYQSNLNSADYTQNEIALSLGYEY